MPLHFKASPGEAIDEKTGLTILYPRVEPAYPPTMPNDGYQFSIYLNDERIDGLGLFCKDVMVERGGHRHCLSLLDLTRRGALDSVFDLKRDLGNVDDDFVFLLGLAHGLVTVFENCDSPDGVHYVVITDEALLADYGITVPGGLARLDSGEIVLAEIILPASS